MSKTWRKLTTMSQKSKCHQGPEVEEGLQQRDGNNLNLKDPGGQKVPGDLSRAYFWSKRSNRKKKKKKKEFPLWLRRLRTQLGSMRMQVHPWPHSVDEGSSLAKSCGVGHRLSSDSTPSLGTSMCCRCGPKKDKTKRSNRGTCRCR